jgi:hypothetical protein
VTATFDADRDNAFAMSVTSPDATSERAAAVILLKALPESRHCPVMVCAPGDGVRDGRGVYVSSDVGDTEVPTLEPQMIVGSGHVTEPVYPWMPLRAWPAFEQVRHPVLPTCTCSTLAAEHRVAMHLSPVAPTPAA